MKFMSYLKYAFFAIAFVMFLYGVITEGMIVGDKLDVESQRAYTLNEVPDPTPPTLPSSFFFLGAGFAATGGILTICMTVLVRRYNSQKAVDRIMEAAYPLTSPMDRWHVK